MGNDNVSKSAVNLVTHLPRKDCRYRYRVLTVPILVPLYEIGT
jgi:hypothetical protein